MMSRWHLQGVRRFTSLLALSILWTAPQAYAEEPPSSEPTVPPPIPTPSKTGEKAAGAGAGATSEVARLRAEAARAYYKAGKYVLALEEFKKAHEISPTAGLTYNIGRCHERLSQWKEAITWYEAYVKLETNPRDKAEALDKIELLKSKLGQDDNTPEGRYRARMKAGRDAYGKGDYEGAIEEFKAAFDIKASQAALFNIAKSYEKMGRYEEAIDHYTQYLDLDPNASDRADVENTIKRLKRSIKSRFQELSIASDPPGADIYVDDRNSGIQGQTNFRLKLPPGPHTVFLDLNGYEPVKRAFVMPDDKPLALDFKMKELENVGHVLINVDRPGARIFIDGAIVGLSPYTQKKALEAGPHQITVELAGHDRYSQNFTVERDQTLTLEANLKKYEPPVQDSTLSSWGRNLILIGIIGGGLGFGVPYAFDKLSDSRSRFEQLGPETIGAGLYKGPVEEGDATFRKDGQLDTLQTIQFWSIIGGSVFVAAGLGFYIYKWARTVPPPPATAGWTPKRDAPMVRITGLGFAPTPNGPRLGLSGSF